MSRRKEKEALLWDNYFSLNTNGGTIYIGIEDNGTVIGVQETDNVLRRISDCITDQIEPSSQGEVTTEIIYEARLPVVKVNVKKGIKPLYCIKKYGFSSKGCLMRIGTACKEISSEEIQYRYKQQFTNEDYMLQVQAKFTPLSFDMMKILLISRGFHVSLRTGISRRSVSRAIASLSEKKYIERIGNNKTGFRKVIR